MSRVGLIVLVGWLCACTGHVPTPKNLNVNMRGVARLDGVAVNPSSGRYGKIRALGRWKSKNSGITHYEVDVGAWSRLFARELRSRYTAIGVDARFGPVLRVQVLELRRRKKGTFFPNYVCRMTVRVSVGQLQRNFAARHEMRSKWTCMRKIAARIVRQIVDDAFVRAEMVSARRR